MSDLELFCQAMDGEWVVERYELEGDRLRVHYRSLVNLLIVWSHQPLRWARWGESGSSGTSHHRKE